MALRPTLRRTSSAVMYEFIDPSYLNNKRPAVPGGAWPMALLRKKSFADLQQLWFATLKERNMLASTKHHYLVHQEELGAMPGPGRIKMVDETLANIKQVMRERDFEATDKAIAIFKERLKKGIYRYPPGPQLPPEHGLESSKITVKLSKKVSEDRLRELFGRFDVYEPHKGIAKVTIALTQEALAEKEVAENNWAIWRRSVRTFEDYHAYDDIDSIYDFTDVELAPGTYDKGGERAVDIPVPDPVKPHRPPTNQMELLRWQSKKGYERENIQFTQYPHNTMEAPEEPLPRPIHPDEIEGPWHATIEYDRLDGLEYARGLGITTIDGAEVLAIEEGKVDEHGNISNEPEPYATRCPIYQEAVRAEEADQSFTYQFPNMPTWKNDYDRYSRRKLEDIIQYNYNNVIEYVDREVLMTGKSMYEMPITIDYSCGGEISVPAHAKRETDTRFSPKEMMEFY